MLTLKLTCPQCGKMFTVEHLAAEREIARLKREIADLRTKLAGKEAMYKNDPLGGLGKMFGL
jgi:transcription initiation factor IIE alpha subunit